MLSPSNILNYYKRQDIQQAMIDNASNREIAIRYSEKGFGKRPDILKYPHDILHLVKEGATSFHSSEELWKNPLHISVNMKRNEAENLRTGWDLVLDIDCPFWEISKITAWLIVKGLQDFGINAISVKFSGNKGFHIGVPFESFPDSHNGKQTKDLFPDAPRNIASYLLEYITERYISVKENNDIIFGEGLKRRYRIPYVKLQQLTGKTVQELTFRICSRCKRKITEEGREKIAEFICPKCESSIRTEAGDLLQICAKCNFPMEKKELGKSSLCSCGSDDYYIKFNPLSIIEVDTILISSRHLFRMPFSLHEKSGLASIPFNPEKILDFEKRFARPEIVRVSKHVFLDRTKSKQDEAKDLFEKAMSFSEKAEEQPKTQSAFESLEEAIPETLFPPCIKKMLAGLEDGKKRAIFILINFLKCMGWDYDMIEKRIREWNEKNPDPLKETIVTGQLRYRKSREKILPPNCANQMYYKDLQVCIPDNFCPKIKNPVNYSVLKAKIGKRD